MRLCDLQLSIMLHDSRALISDDDDDDDGNNNCNVREGEGGYTQFIRV